MIQFFLSGQKIYQRRYTDGKTTHEKTLNIIVIREMQIKITVRIRCTPMRAANIRKMDHTKSCKDMERPELSYAALGNSLTLS